MDAEALASALIPDPANTFSQSGADFFFRQSARTLIVGLLDAVKSQGAGRDSEAARAAARKLKEALRGHARRGAHRSGRARAGRRDRRDGLQRDQFVPSSVRDPTEQAGARSNGRERVRAGSSSARPKTRARRRFRCRASGSIASCAA